MVIQELTMPFVCLIFVKNKKNMHVSSLTNKTQDKNYAGVLIIWDRMFGTFEWERENEKIVYGLVDQPQFFNPLRHQVGNNFLIIDIY